LMGSRCKTSNPFDTLLGEQSELPGGFDPLLGEGTPNLHIELGLLPDKERPSEGDHDVRRGHIALREVVQLGGKNH